MDLRKLLDGNRPVIAAGIIYTITAIIVVLSAWIEELHDFDFEITISIYVALRHWTAWFYLISASLMVALLFYFLKNIEMNKVKKVIYSLAFIAVEGCAIFPCNREWSNLATEIHNIFAYILMLMVTIAFVFTLIKAENKNQRIFGVLSVSYAIFFILSFVLGWAYFSYTIFFWENTFIYFLLGGLLLEYKESRALEIFSKKFPFVGLGGIVLSWFLCLSAPSEGHSIDDTNPPYWRQIGYANFILFVAYLILVISFISYLLYRPLAEKRKWLDIILRIIIGIVGVFFVTIGAYLSAFIFVGGGG